MKTLLIAISLLLGTSGAEAQTAAKLNLKLGLTAIPTTVSTATRPAASIRWVAAQDSSILAGLHFTGAGSCRVSIWSRDGKPLHQEELAVQAGERGVVFSPGNWPHGVYILTVSVNETNTSRLFTY